MRTSDEQPPDEAQQPERPWALRAGCVGVAIALAAVSEILSIGAAVAARAAGDPNPGFWILALFLLLIYGFVYALCYRAAVIDQKGPASERFPRWYRALWPRWALALADAIYPVLPNFFLVVFPALGTLVSVGVLWGALAGQWNP